MSTAPQLFLASSIAKFDSTVRRARWMAISTVIITLPYNQLDYRPVALLVAAGSIFNVAQYWLVVKQSRIFSSTLFVTTVDLVLIAFVLNLVGGIQSPYLLFLAFPLLLVLIQRTSRRWFEAVYIIAAVSSVIIVNAAVGSKPVYYPDWHRAIISVLLLMVLAYFINHLTRDLRAGRSEALLLRTSAESERQRLVTLIESMNEGVMAVGSDRVIIMHNKSMQSILGIEQLDGVGIEKLPELGMYADGTISFVELLGTKAIFRRRDLTIKRSDGSYTKLEASVAPMKSVRGHIDTDNAFIVILRDITTEKDIEDQRREFLSIISHELRTPVASAEAGISMLLNKNLVQLDQKGEEFAAIAYKQILFLAELINDIATLSKLEDDIFVVEPEALHCKDFLGLIQQEYTTNAKSKGLDLKVEIGDNLPVVITSLHEVKEILQNFITNAIKYTESGTVTIGAAATPEKSGYAGIILSVKDSGIGIAQNDVERVFDKFYRSEDYRTRRTGGTGLGLYICKKLSDRLGAKIWVESDLNKGSTFYLELPPFSSVKKDSKQIMQAQMNTLITSI